jgi:hypothetical protein
VQTFIAFADLIVFAVLLLVGYIAGRIAEKAHYASIRKREKLFERVLPRLSSAALSELLQSAHQVDGIVKGLRFPEWPANGWQALHRLAMTLCRLCGEQGARAG